MLITDVTVRVGKWASLPLLLLVACGVYFAFQCQATSFFGATFGRDCETDRIGAGTSWINSTSFQGELAAAMQRGTGSALMVGTSFYNSVQDPALLAAVDRGVDLRYVFLNPKIGDELLRRIAGAFGQDANDLRSELSNTYYGLSSVYCKLVNEEKEGHLNVRVLDESIGTRMYFYNVSDGETAKGTDAVAFVVPYVHGHDSPNLPGFKVGGDVGKA